MSAAPNEPVRPVVVHDETHRRFEVPADGGRGELLYRLEPGIIVFLHTEVPEPARGAGLASALARAGLEYAREHGLAVVARCPFVASYIRRHPEYAPLVKRSSDA